jgi:Fe-S-cluster-containing hydrogenase component 2
VKAHYGYDDGSGSFFITIDTDLCNGCEECIRACPALALGMIEEDPVEERWVAAVVEEHRKQIKYTCNPCKPSGTTVLPCVEACAPRAITHSW